MKREDRQSDAYGRRMRLSAGEIALAVALTLAACAFLVATAFDIGRQELSDAMAFFKVTK